MIGEVTQRNFFTDTRFDKYDCTRDTLVPERCTLHVVRSERSQQALGEPLPTLPVRCLIAWRAAPRNWCGLRAHRQKTSRAEYLLYPVSNVAVRVNEVDNCAAVDRLARVGNVLIDDQPVQIGVGDAFMVLSRTLAPQSFHCSAGQSDLAAQSSRRAPQRRSSARALSAHRRARHRPHCTA